MHYLQTWPGWSFASSVNSAKYPPCTRHRDRPREKYLLASQHLFISVSASSPLWLISFLPLFQRNDRQEQQQGPFTPVFSAFVKRASLKAVYQRGLVLRTGCGSPVEPLPSIPLAPAQTANHSNNNETDPLPFVLLHQIQLCATSKYLVSFLTFPKPKPSALIIFCWGGGFSV